MPIISYWKTLKGLKVALLAFFIDILANMKLTGVHGITRHPFGIGGWVRSAALNASLLIMLKVVPNYAMQMCDINS